MRSYKRSVKNNKKRTRRSFIKKKRTKINRRTKGKGKTILRGGVAQRAIDLAAATSAATAAADTAATAGGGAQKSYVARAQREYPQAAQLGENIGEALSTPFDSKSKRNYTMFLGTKSCILMAYRLAELYDSNIDKFLEIKQKVNDLSFNASLSDSVKYTLLARFIKELNEDLTTNCSEKDINYYNITEIIELFGAIERGEIKTPKGRDKQSWSEWFSELELFGKNDPKTFNPREPIQPIFTEPE